MADKREHGDDITFLGRRQYSETDMHRIIYNLLCNDKLGVPELKGGFYFPECYGADIFRIGMVPPKTIEGTLIEIKYNDNKAEYIIKQIKDREYTLRNVILPDFKKKAEAAYKNTSDLELKIDSMLMHNSPSKKLVELCKRNDIKLIKYSEPDMNFEQIY